ncbi:MAG: Cof-type HAD-IIB family hydrolase [Bacilli bacterium]|nr:Cof-type HAD-IIB family hydrolase [Bacilli bacterium]
MENKNNKYLISVDLDSTLLRDHIDVSENTLTYIHELIAKGHHFIINTGRPWQSACQFQQLLGIHEPIISTNGGLVCVVSDDYKKIISNIQYNVDLEIVKKILLATKSYTYGYALTTMLGFYSNDISMLPPWLVHDNERITIYDKCLEVDEIKEKPIHLELFCNNNDDAEMILVVLEAYSSKIDYTHWAFEENFHTFEVVAKGCSKGRAMLDLADSYGISHDHILAFGDQLNDLSMLELASPGVAMINSNPEVLSRIKETTELDSEHDGVVEYLKKHIKL